MTEQLLHAADIGAGVEQVSGKLCAAYAGWCADRVRPGPGTFPAAGPTLRDDRRVPFLFRNSAASVAARGTKQVVAGRQPRIDGSNGRWSQQGQAFPPTLAANRRHSFPQVNIGRLSWVNSLTRRPADTAFRGSPGRAYRGDDRRAAYPGAAACRRARTKCGSFLSVRGPRSPVAGFVVSMPGGTGSGTRSAWRRDAGRWWCWRNPFRAARPGRGAQAGC